VKLCAKKGIDSEEKRYDLKALCSKKGKISGNFCFERMNLGMIDRFCPIQKTRAQLEERRFYLNKSDRDSERYVIPMHRKNFWTDKWT
jgi:hypothetical protein